MCVELGWEGDSSVQIGPLQPMERPSPLYYELLRSWVRRCDDDHAEFGCHAASQTMLPTRVVDVGDDSTNRGLVRLVCTKTSDRGRYIALSHCWGKPSAEEKEQNCTFAANLEERCLRIDLTKLGKTFQDAVKVTRGLGQRYLWIDSLCILQDDPDDWERESRRMETVFSLAYCVIAATAAEGTDTGFLKPPPPNRFVALPTPSLSAPLYLCTTVDDFHGDVEVASLGRRGWVLQERALARRTIHFSAGQTYWECGRGIHCESLSLLKNPETASFLGDPQFPKLAMAQATASNTRHHVFQAIFSTYSRLELTRATDRPVAVAGVARRLANEIGSPVAFGIFANFEWLHRSLLWQRAGDTPLQCINNQCLHVPTWSWMAYTGPIDYVTVSATEVEWNREISLLATTSTGRVELTAPITSFTAEMSRNPNLLVLDACGMANIQNLRCIVVGKALSRSSRSQGEDDMEAYHVIVVSPAQTGTPCIEYERLGIATVYQTHLALERQRERACII